MCGRGVCMAGVCMAGGVHMHGRGHAWWGGMDGRGYVWRGACMVGAGHACRGACMARGMCGGGDAWQGWACVAGKTATAAGIPHPTGMHSCNTIVLINHKRILSLRGQGASRRVAQREPVPIVRMRHERIGRSDVNKG